MMRIARLTFFFALLLVSASVDAAKAPDIVIILADDLGWNDVGYHGSELATPRIDDLASRGVRLERFYAAPMCTPTRVALMSGLHGFRLGLTGGVIRPDSEAALPGDVRILPELLKDAGYTTAIVGKWHLGHAKPEFLPTARGFDHQYGHYLGHIDYFTHSQGNRHDWYRNGEPVREAGYATDLLAREAVRLIEAMDFNAAPLFLYLPFNAPHGPRQATEADIALVQAATRDELKGCRLTYGAQVFALDRAIGAVVDALKAKGAWENTFFFFSSDNGGTHHFAHECGDNSPLTGQKGQLYDGGIRVPAFISFPPRLSGVAESDVVLHVVDLLPTAMMLAGVDLPGRIDGEDMLAAIERGTTTRDRLILYADDISAAVIEGHYKLMINPRRQMALPFRGVTQVYDISRPTPERLDHIAFPPDGSSSMRERLRLDLADKPPQVIWQLPQ